MTHNTKTALWTLGTLLALGVASCHAEAFGYRPIPLTNYTVSLAWTASPQAYGYKVYRGPVSLTETNFIDVGNVTSCTLQFPTPVTRQYFYVTAYDAIGSESTMSNEVWYPGDVWTFFQDLCSTNLINWTPTNLPLAFKQPAGTAFFVKPSVSNWTDYGNP